MTLWTPLPSHPFDPEFLKLLCQKSDMADYSEKFLNTLSSRDNTEFETVFVFPGRNICNSIMDAKRAISVGDGLCQNGPVVSSTISGKLCYREPISFWVSHVTSSYKSNFSRLMPLLIIPL